MNRQAPTARDTLVSEEIKAEILLHGLEIEKGNLLRWPVGDAGHPRNWSAFTKASNTLVIISLDFFTFVFPSYVWQR